MTTLIHKNDSIRFRRGWSGRQIGSIATAAELGYGQRDALVMRGIAEWVDAEPETAKHRQPRRSFQREQ